MKVPDEAFIESLIQHYELRYPVGDPDSFTMKFPTGPDGVTKEEMDAEIDEWDKILHPERYR